MLKKTIPTILAASLALWTIAGCSDEAKKDYGEAGNDASKAARETGEGISKDTSNAGEAIKSGADKAGKSLSDTAEKTEIALKNDETSARVKQGLLAAKDLNTTDLKIDTDGMKVKLSGTVPSVKEKMRAEDIAKNILGSQYKVENNLTVAGF